MNIVLSSSIESQTKPTTKHGTNTRVTIKTITKTNYEDQTNTEHVTHDSPELDTTMTNIHVKATK